jgi:hypothetical protein
MFGALGATVPGGGLAVADVVEAPAGLTTVVSTVVLPEILAVVLPQYA